MIKMKKIIKFLVLVLLAFLVYYGFITYPKLDLISGFSAKSMASGHFIDNRSQQIIESGDNDIDLIDKATNYIDEENKCATASVFGLKKRTAIYRPGLGATLITDDFDTSKPYLVPKRTQSKPQIFPYGDLEPKDTLFSTVNYMQLKKAVANAFDVSNQKEKRTRAVLVIYKDKIIAEKYAPGFNKNSKILGWSMAKSITGTLFGILQKQKTYDIYKPAPIQEWAKDKRAKITTANLLNMNSGLEWEEDYTKICDVTQMLFQAKNMAMVQIDKPAAFAPNTHWNYSSGTTNVLSEILRRQFKTHQEYLDFWYSALIDKIGMHSMVLETDMAGNYVGSSYGWATARDWAKFGLLYLHQGNWNGEQLFDSSWVKFVTTPTATSGGEYGGHFYLNTGKMFKDVTTDLYFCWGYQGQMILIFPSLDLVVVRMGLESKKGFDFNLFLKEITQSIEKK